MFQGLKFGVRGLIIGLARLIQQEKRIRKLDGKIKRSPSYFP